MNQRTGKRKEITKSVSKNRCQFKHYLCIITQNKKAKNRNLSDPSQSLVLLTIINHLRRLISLRGMMSCSKNL